MNKNLLIIFTLLISTVEAQVSITSSDFANANDTVRVSISSNTNIDLTQTGTNQVWDFSSLVAESQKLYEFNSMSNLPLFINLKFGLFAPSQYKASYSQLTDALPLDAVNTILPVTLDEMKLYSKLEPSGLTACGYSVSYSGTEIPIQSDTIETYYELPLNFGDVYSSTGYTRLDLNPIQDIQWSQYRQRTSNVDGWGSVITPYGTFDCLRVRHTISETDSIYVSLLSSWVPIPLPNQIIYEWWAQGEKLPIVTIKARSLLGSEAVTSVEFRDNYNASLVASIQEEQMTELSIYPNPVTEIAHIHGVQSTQDYQLFDSKGALQMSGTLSETNPSISVLNLKAGVYLLLLENGAKLPLIKK